MFKICDDIQTRLVHFTDQKKATKKKLKIETDPS